MINQKLETLITVAELGNFTRAAAALNLTQPAVSHQISTLEQELGATLLIRRKSGLIITPEGEIALRYARRIAAMEEQMVRELQDAEHNLTSLRVGITHTSETNLTMEALAKCSGRNLSITIITDTIKNLYDKLRSYEIDLAIVDGPVIDHEFNSVMLDTDYLVCVMSNSNPLSRRNMVTLSELKNERMIMRLSTSATRQLFDSTLESLNDSIDNYDVTMEMDNVATIKDLIRKGLGVSILPRSACINEIRKHKLTALPIENLSMAREARIVYNKDFDHIEILQNITEAYRQTVSESAS